VDCIKTIVTYQPFPICNPSRETFRDKDRKNLNCLEIRIYKDWGRIAPIWGLQNFKDIRNIAKLILLILEFFQRRTSSFCGKNKIY